MFYWYKTYESVKFTILKFSNACKTNERKRGFGGNMDKNTIKTRLLQDERGPHHRNYR